MSPLATVAKMLINPVGLGVQLQIMTHPGRSDLIDMLLSNATCYSHIQPCLGYCVTYFHTTGTESPPWVRQLHVPKIRMCSGKATFNRISFGACITQLFKSVDVNATRIFIAYINITKHQNHVNVTPAPFSLSFSLAVSI